jgi:hypothetical protein
MVGKESGGHLYEVDRVNPGSCGRKSLAMAANMVKRAGKKSAAWENAISACDVVESMRVSRYEAVQVWGL